MRQATLLSVARLSIAQRSRTWVMRAAPADRRPLFTSLRRKLAPQSARRFSGLVLAKHLPRPRQVAHELADLGAVHARGHAASRSECSTRRPAGRSSAKRPQRPGGGWASAWPQVGEDDLCRFARKTGQPTPRYFVDWNEDNIGFLSDEKPQSGAAVISVGYNAELGLRAVTLPPRGPHHNDTLPWWSTRIRESAAATWHAYAAPNR